MRELLNHAHATFDIVYFDNRVESHIMEPALPGGLLDSEEVLDALVRGVEGVDEGVHAGAVGAVGHDGGGAGEGRVGGVGGGVLVEAEVPVRNNFVSLRVIKCYLRNTGRSIRSDGWVDFNP